MTTHSVAPPASRPRTTGSRSWRAAAAPVATCCGGRRGGVRMRMPPSSRPATRRGRSTQQRWVRRRVGGRVGGRVGAILLAAASFSYSIESRPPNGFASRPRTHTFPHARTAMGRLGQRQGGRRRTINDRDAGGRDGAAAVGLAGRVRRKERGRPLQPKLHFSSLFVHMMDVVLCV